jgi:hypothetical protein
MSVKAVRSTFEDGAAPQLVIPMTWSNIMMTPHVPEIEAQRRMANPGAKEVNSMQVREQSEPAASGNSMHLNSTPSPFFQVVLFNPQCHSFAV